MLKKPDEIVGVSAQKRYSLKKDVLEWIEAVVFSVIAVVLLFTFVVRIVGVDGHSMNPTLKDLDRVIISNLFYTPDNGDIVVISETTGIHKPIIKRVIATEGQIVDIDFVSGTVFVDGEALEEDYTAMKTYDQYDVAFPVTVPKDCIFVLGDNRGNSADSRTSGVGMVNEKTVLGKAILRIYPFSTFGTLG